MSKVQIAAHIIKGRVSIQVQNGYASRVSVIDVAQIIGTQRPDFAILQEYARLMTETGAPANPDIMVGVSTLGHTLAVLCALEVRSGDIHLQAEFG